MSVIYSLITGRLSGWRLKMVIVLLVLAVPLGIWAMMEPRSIAHGTWDIDPGRAQTLGVEATKTVKMKVECVPTAGGDQPYAIYVVDEDNKERLKSANGGAFETLATVEGTGTLTLPPTPVTPGNYYVVVENRSQSRLSVSYKIYQMRN